MRVPLTPASGRANRIGNTTNGIHYSFYLLPQDRKYHYRSMVTREQGSLLDGKYITIGGRPLDWGLAGLKRVTGVSLFPTEQELFWVRFPHSAEALEALAELAERGKVRPVVACEVQMEDESVRGAFAKLHARRTVGKLVIRVAGEEQAASSTK